MNKEIQENNKLPKFSNNYNYQVESFRKNFFNNINLRLVFYYFFNQKIIYFL